MMLDLCSFHREERKRETTQRGERERDHTEPVLPRSDKMAISLLCHHVRAVSVAPLRRPPVSLTCREDVSFSGRKAGFPGPRSVL